ncbi:MAG: type II toxin-antitoxin system HipA family toxin [Alphaproteobacteria bacterium]|nr:type II toxin-antitoxin system HipA family toxin [Alphaproteobacteria bacterium]
MPRNGRGVVATMTSTTSRVFIHARLADATSRLVGACEIVPMMGSALGVVEYARSWTESGRAFPLHPDLLPLRRGQFTLRTRGGLGCLADSTPDLWGRRIIAASMNPPPADGPAWLLATGDDRVGCLAFSKTPSLGAVGESFGSVMNLERIAEAFQRIERGEPADPLSEHLYRAGISLGGVRPKAVVDYEGHLWIAKFQRRTDEFDQCGAEDAAMRLAARCGIDAAETRMCKAGSHRVVLVRRFDRSPGPPYHPTGHFLSALSALDLDETSGDGSYPQIADFLHRHSAAHRVDREELFRRMVFNVLIGNRDDHLKNHAIMHRPGTGWRLTPAFDVLPQPDMDPVQAISVGKHGTTPSIANCLTRCGEFGLHEDPARALIETIVARLRGWRTFYGESGVDGRTIDRLRRAFSPTLDPAN